MAKPVSQKSLKTNKTNRHVYSDEVEQVVVWMLVWMLMDGLTDMSLLKRARLSVRISSRTFCWRAIAADFWGVDQNGYVFMY